MKIAAIVTSIAALIAAAASSPIPDNASANSTQNADDGGDVDMLIVGGTEMPKGKALYTTGLRKTEDGSLFCGGSLIDESHVLSAAHCYVGDAQYVSIGSHYASGNTDGVRVRVKTVTQHPDYFAYFTLNDFMILELETPVDTKKYPPVKIANKSKKDIVDGRTATLIGWGKTSTGGQLSNVLLKVDMPLWTEPTCEKKIDAFGPIVCAGGDDKTKSPCNGDSGGPLIVKDTDGSDVLVGVVSWGRKCGEDGTPSVYASPADVADWIKSMAPNAQFD